MERILQFLGIIAVLLGAVFILLSKFLPLLDVYESLLAHLGTAFVTAGFVELLIKYAVIKHIVDEIREKFQQSMSDLSQRLRISLDAFYQRREDLPSTLENEIANSKECWLAWHTGTVQAGGGILGISNVIKRLLLTQPSSQALKEVTKVVNRSYDAMKTDIEELTKEAQKRGIPVKWFDGPIINSLVISNPSEQDAWARIEILIPNAEVKERPSIRVSKDKGNFVLNNIISGYNFMWDKATEPPKQS